MSFSSDDVQGKLSPAFRQVLRLSFSFPVVLLCLWQQRNLYGDL
jgi:hypothetical protein